MKRLYLVLAIVGAIVPYVFFIQYFAVEGQNFAGFLSAAVANGAVAGLTADLLISSFIFWIAMFARRRQGKGPNPALFIVLNLTIGLCCALPAYLYASTDRS
jgi:hypothetical protein